MKDNICKEKMALVEKLGVHLEQKEQLAPVAARIFSYIILTGKVGTTFEDLVHILCASKSTISTHLNHLQDLNMILYFTKTGDRKKYFVVNRDSIILNIDKMMDSWSMEKRLHEEVKSYKQTINELETTLEEDKFDLEFHNEYIKFIDDATESIGALRTKIKNNQFNI